MNETNNSSFNIKNFTGNLRNAFSKDSIGKDNVKNKKYDFFLNRMESLEGKLKELEEVSSVGLPLTEAKENVNILKNIEEQNKKTESKLNLYIAKVREVKNAMQNFEELSRQKVTVSQLNVLNEKVKYLEELSKEIQKSKTKEVLLQVVGLLEKIEKKVSVLEKKTGEYVIQDEEITLTPSSEQLALYENKESEENPSFKEKANGFFKRLFGG